MPSHPDAESYRLRFSPYAPPQVSIGDEIQCDIRGLVTVADWRDCGDIMWPRCKTSRRRALIVTGDLVRAMASETELAVAKLWSVAPHTVMRWKVTLGLPARTPGTEAVLAAKARESMTGRKALPQVKAGLLRAAKRPKSKLWKGRLSARNALREITLGKAIPGRRPDRTIAILTARKDGKSLSEIAKEAGVIPQRIMQILAEAGVRRASWTAPRCRCGRYSVRHALKIDHQCV